MYYNKNGATFCDRYGNTVCTTKFKSGLGKTGERLCIAETVDLDKYVPFKKIRDGIFNLDWAKDVNGKCWRCEKKWNLEGVDPNLNYFAATCGCEYDK